MDRAWKSAVDTRLSLSLSLSKIDDDARKTGKGRGRESFIDGWTSATMLSVVLGLHFLMK